MSRKPMSRGAKVFVGLFWTCILIAVLAHFAPPEPAGVLPDYSYKGPETLRQAAEAAYKHLLADCPRIERVGADISSVSMRWDLYEAGQSQDFRRRDYGWKNDLWVHMEVKQEHTAPDWGPSRGFYDSEPVDFIVGGGRRPGIDLFGQPAYILCDRSFPASHRNGFKRAPEMSAIDDAGD